MDDCSILGAMRYRIVQPYGRDKAREATFQSEHATVAEAFAAIDETYARMRRLGGTSTGVELIVIDEQDRIVPPYSK